MSFITYRQSGFHASFWIRRNGSHAGAVQQLMVPDDFGNLVAVSHDQFRISTAD